MDHASEGPIVSLRSSCTHGVRKDSEIDIQTRASIGASDPGIANWANTGGAGQLALFYMLVPLSASRKFKIHTYLSGSLYVDVWGYLY